MKKLFLLPVVAIFTACNADFINLTPISDQNVENFYRSESDINQAIIGAYDAIQSQYRGDFSYFMEVRSDNSYNSNTTANGGAQADFDNFTLASSNYVLNNAWNACYRGIQRCNIILNRIGAVDMDEQLKTYRSGEAKFMRALTYFNMVRIWGDVPLIIEEIDDPFAAFEHTRTPIDAVYAQITTDLEEAIAQLPDSWERGADLGRVTKGAARTLLGKIHLTRHDYEQALAEFETIIGSGLYELVPEYGNIFGEENENNSESIFEIQFKSDAFGEGNSDGGLFSAGDGDNFPSANMLDLFSKHNDDRFAASVEVSYNTPKFAKLKAERGADGSFGANTIVLRYADVLLMASEARNELGYNTGQAFDYLNQVRKRAGTTAYTEDSLPDQSSFRLAIELERRLELAFENHRWFDLLRTGRALEVMSTTDGVAAFDITIKPHQLLFPIPLAQIDASGGLITPNPGY